jgi:hypothetical protein
MREDRLREDQVEDDEDFLDYAEDEGSRPADGRNQRLLIITLSVGCLALAVSNVVLAMRVKDLTKSAGTSATAPAVADTATEPASSPDEPSPAVAEPKEPVAAASIPSAPPAATPAPPAARATAPPAAQDPAPPSAAPRSPTSDRAPGAIARAPEPAAKAPAPEPVGKATRPPVDLPPRGTPGASVRDVPSRGSESRPAAGASRERMTAAWMVQEHGRQDAEKRARAVADFYGSSAEGAFWRRVLGEIVSDRR